MSVENIGKEDMRNDMITEQKMKIDYDFAVSRLFFKNMSIGDLGSAVNVLKNLGHDVDVNKLILDYSKYRELSHT